MNVRYQDLTPREFRRRIADAPIAYLPLGTLEWHGEHLPLGSDGMISSGFFEPLARDVGGIVLPMLFLGPDRRVVQGDLEWFGMDSCRPDSKHPYPSQPLPGSAYWIDNDLFVAILRAILKQLARAGFKIIVAHGHGPSTMLWQQYRPQWQKEFGVTLLDCWADGLQPAMGIQTDHAATNETSLMMALHPDLVHLEYLGDDRGQFPVAVGPDDPRDAAGAALGRQSLELNRQRMAQILRAAIT